MVLDASIVVPLTFPTEASPRAAAAVRHAEAVIAPDLVIAEVTNVAATFVRTGHVTARVAQQNIEELQDGFDALLPSAELTPHAIRIALEVHHSAYDCFYLALAEFKQDDLLTADKRLLSRLAGTRYEGLARLL